jgi:hypothetical protein
LGSGEHSVDTLRRTFLFCTVQGLTSEVVALKTELHIARSEVAAAHAATTAATAAAAQAAADAAQARQDVEERQPLPVSPKSGRGMLTLPTL